MGDRIDHFINIETTIHGHVAGGSHIVLNTHAGMPMVEPPPSNAPGARPTHRSLTDAELGRYDRPYLPMVNVFDDRRCTLTKEWQMFFVGVNYGMRDNNLSHTWADDVAFCNKTGFGGRSDRRDYILMEHMENELPQTDKTRTCGNALVQLTPSVLVGKTITIRLLSLIKFLREYLQKNYPEQYFQQYKVLCFNGTNNPPLKPGAVYPADVTEAYQSWDRWLYNPRDNPCYFFPCTVTGADHNAHAWPNAARYDWYKQGSEPVCWMFHLAPNADINWPPTQMTANTPRFVAV